MNSRRKIIILIAYNTFIQIKAKGRAGIAHTASKPVGVVHRLISQKLRCEIDFNISNIGLVII